MSVSNKALVLLACLMLVATPGRAQVDFGWMDPSMYSSTLLTDLAMENLIDSHKDEVAPHSHRKRPPAGSASKGQASRGHKAHGATLDFRPSQAVSERVARNFLRQLPKSMATPEVRAYVQSFQYKKDYRAATRGFKLSDRNVADVLAVYLAGAWTVVHDRHVDRAEVMRPAQAISRDMARRLGNNPRLAAATDAQRQELAELLILNLVAIDGRHELYKLSGGAPLADGSTLAGLQATVRRGAMQWGVDLAKLDMSDRGFVPLRK